MLLGDRRFRVLDLSAVVAGTAISPSLCLYCACIYSSPIGWLLEAQTRTLGLVFRVVVVRVRDVEQNRICVP